MRRGAPALQTPRLNYATHTSSVEIPHSARNGRCYCSRNVCVTWAVPYDDVGQLMLRLRLDAPYFFPPGATDTMFTRLTASTFGGSLDDYLLWRANWHRVRGERTLARVNADSARRSRCSRGCLRFPRTSLWLC